MPTARPADETAIREQAYYFWEQDGRPEGRETEYWMRAQVAVAEKEQLDQLVKPAPKKAQKPKAAATKSKSAPTKAEPTGKSVPAKAEKPKKK